MLQGFALVIPQVNWPQAFQDHILSVCKDNFILLLIFIIWYWHGRSSIFCSDGVSEGQFSQVLLYEIDSIRKVFSCLTRFSRFRFMRLLAIWYAWCVCNACCSWSFCQACASLQDGYLPTITFVVVQKRHHTRLFPENHRARDQTDRSGNILPGMQALS